MQLIHKADYALQLVLEVAPHSDGPIRTVEVSRRQQIPYEFLRKIAQVLASNGLLESERGVGGGLTLARPAQEITVLDIVRAFGSPALNRCTANPPRCDRSESCAVFPDWIEAQKEVERVLSGTHFSEMTERHPLLRDD